MSIVNFEHVIAGWELPTANYYFYGWDAISHPHVKLKAVGMFDEDLEGSWSNLKSLRTTTKTI